MLFQSYGEVSIISIFQIIFFDQFHSSSNLGFRPAINFFQPPSQWYKSPKVLITQFWPTDYEVSYKIEKCYVMNSIGKWASFIHNWRGSNWKTLGFDGTWFSTSICMFFSILYSRDFNFSQHSRYAFHHPSNKL